MAPQVGSDQVLLHWPLADGGLFVQGGDNIRLVIKASYRMNAAEVETGVIAASSRDGETSGGGGGGGGGMSARSSFSGFGRRSSQSASPSSASLGRASLALRDDKKKVEAGRERREGELRRLGAARHAGSGGT